MWYQELKKRFKIFNLMFWLFTIIYGLITYNTNGHSGLTVFLGLFMLILVLGCNLQDYVDKALLKNNKKDT